MLSSRISLEFERARPGHCAALNVWKFQIGIGQTFKDCATHSPLGRLITSAYDQNQRLLNSFVRPHTIPNSKLAIWRDSIGSIDFLVLNFCSIQLRSKRFVHWPTKLRDQHSNIALLDSIKNLKVELSPSSALSQCYGKTYTVSLLVKN